MDVWPDDENQNSPTMIVIIRDSPMLLECVLKQIVTVIQRS